MERLPGFRDFYPEPLPSRDAGWSLDARQYVFDQWRAVARRYGFREYDGPPLEHFQFNADIIGETDPAADAELIALLIDSLRAFGLTAGDFVIRLSSRNAWQDFFAARCRDHTKAYEFFQAIDKLERTASEES